MCLVKRRRRQLTSTDSEKSIQEPRRYQSGASASVKTTSSNFKNYGKLILKDLTSLWVPGVVYESGDVLVWRFPYHISQTRHGGRKQASSACSLIAIYLADSIFRKGVHMPIWNGDEYIDLDATSCPSKNSNMAALSTHFKLLSLRITDAMVNAMVDGNNKADTANQFQNNKLFTVPDALSLTGSTFGEVCYTSTKSTKGDATVLLYGNLKSAIEHPAVHNWKQLFFLVMLVERCVLVVYERDTESLVILDSHTHIRCGAIVAVSNRRNLLSFCKFIIKELYPETMSLEPRNMKFELSFLYFKGILSDYECPIDTKYSQRVESLHFNRPRVFDNYYHHVKALEKMQSLRKKNKFGIL